jgi:UDP-3-O-[3-hydroxymyristoyl] glucosamine N-acyltransferase
MTLRINNAAIMNSSCSVSRSVNGCDRTNHHFITNNHPTGLWNTEDAVIGPGVVIGRNVQLGSAVVIMANSVIEFDVVIGARTVIYPSCVVSYDCHIGADCILKAGQWL